MTDVVSAAATETYFRLKRVFAGDPKSYSRSSRTTRSSRRGFSTGRGSVPFGKGRDPEPVADVLAGLTADLGWNTPLSQSALIASWPTLVGDENAARSSPVSVDNGVLVVRCDSTAWATQLRLMRTEILNRIAEKFADAGIESVTFHGPSGSSWSKGYRSVGGRGPRDTYG